MRSKKISDYALIGNGNTCALVHREGSIDWLCLPHFDSQAFFASILGSEKNGRWELRPLAITSVDRQYVSGTNILKTNFTCKTGKVEIVDFMPIENGLNGIVRKVRTVEGEVTIEENLNPKGFYGKLAPRFIRSENDRVQFGWKDKESKEVVYFRSQKHDIQINDFEISDQISLQKGEVIFFGLFYGQIEERLDSFDKFEKSLETTEGFWRKWTSRSHFQGKHRELVERSAITLKSMIFTPTGAMVAAPSASLPETLGGERNWDYRYSWIRDSVFIVNAFTKIGHVQEAKEFFNWALKSIVDNSSKLAVGFSLEGKTPEEELQLDHLAGFGGSKPVRIGNAGLKQFQLDVYGEFIICLFHCWKNNLIEMQVDLKKLLFNLLNTLLQKRHDQDRGIWEIRGKRRFYTYSQAMAWMGLDQGTKLYQELGGDQLDFREVEKAKREIREQIFSKGVDSKRNCFVQSYGASNLDAANLRLGIMGFVAPKDPIMMGTTDEIKKRLVKKGGVYRYISDDSLEGDEGAFNVCGFWLSQLLAMQGRKQEATEVFEGLLKFSNDLGLYSEEVDVSSNEFLGNFPQAFSHLGVINGAIALQKLNKDKSL